MVNSRLASVSSGGKLIECAASSFTPFTASNAALPPPPPHPNFQLDSNHIDRRSHPRAHSPENRICMVMNTTLNRVPRHCTAVPLPVLLLHAQPPPPGGYDCAHPCRHLTPTLIPRVRAHQVQNHLLYHKLIIVFAVSRLFLQEEEDRYRLEVAQEVDWFC